MASKRAFAYILSVAVLLLALLLQPIHVQAEVHAMNMDGGIGQAQATANQIWLVPAWHEGSIVGPLCIAEVIFAGILLIGIMILAGQPKFRVKFAWIVLALMIVASALIPVQRLSVTENARENLIVLSRSDPEELSLGEAMHLAWSPELKGSAVESSDGWSTLSASLVDPKVLLLWLLSPFIAALAGFLAGAFGKAAKVPEGTNPSSDQAPGVSSHPT